MLAWVYLLAMVTVVSGKTFLREFKTMTAVSSGVEQMFSPIARDSSTFHRCQYMGPPDALKKFLSPAQLYDPNFYYYGRKAECDNGLPKGECLSGLHRTSQCGLPGDWSILGPLDLDGPGVMWKNSSPCYKLQGGYTDVELTVDFYCPNDRERVHLYQCNFEGQPTALIQSAGVSTNEEKKDSSLGYYNVTFTNAHCTNGLPPPKSKCVVSLRWLEFCGDDDHDWEAFSPEHDGYLGIRWYSPHICANAKVGVDYYCPQSIEVEGSKPEEHHALPPPKVKGHSTKETDAIRLKHEAKRREILAEEAAKQIHSCRKIEKSVDDGPCMDRAISNLSDGTCRHVNFSAKDCTNGLPRGKCLIASQRLKECGAEMNFEAYGGNFESDVGVRWFNALPTGPCGPADVQINYLCFNECTKFCEHGVLKEETCECLEVTKH